MDREERGIRSTDPGLDLSQLTRWELEAARDKAAGRLHVLEGIDLTEHLAEPSPATRAAQRDLDTIKTAIVELARREGRPLRPIDTATFVGGRTREEPWRAENVHVEPGRLIRYELAPCPRWMRAELYATIMAKFARAMQDGTLRPTKLSVWAARHIFEWREPPSLVSTDSSRSAIGAALELAYRAKQAGRLEELGRPIRRRLADSPTWLEGVGGRHEDDRREEGRSDAAAQLKRPADQREEGVRPSHVGGIGRRPSRELEP